MNHLSEKLKDLGLWMKPVARDGSCLYRCVADKVREILYIVKI